MVFNATYNNISAISQRSVLLVEETGISGENHRPVASHLQTLSHDVVWSTPRHRWDSNSQQYLSICTIDDILVIRGMFISYCVILLLHFVVSYKRHLEAWKMQMYCNKT